MTFSVRDTLSAMSGGIRLVDAVCCPQCLKMASPVDLLWIAGHEKLSYDARLGAEQQLRFRASSFTVEGIALDPLGAMSRGVACPQCHFALPREVCEKPLHIFSIVGAQDSGKSYFLAAALHELKNRLSSRFGTAAILTGNEDNERIKVYQADLFSQDSTDRRRTAPKGWAVLPKTKQVGDSYNQIIQGGEIHSFPKPSLLDIKPENPERDGPGAVLCFYDNAGEDFGREWDDHHRHVTAHVQNSKVRFFVFDPLQESSFRQACLAAGCMSDDEEPKSVPMHLGFDSRFADPQVVLGSSTHDQGEEFRAVVQRMKILTGLGQSEKDPRLLCYVLTKYDTWSRLPKWQELLRAADPAGQGEVHDPWLETAHGWRLDLDYIRRVSEATKGLMEKMFPNALRAAMASFERVLFFPVSATGRGAQIIPEDGRRAFRQPLAPRWVDVPLLVAMNEVGLAVPPVATYSVEQGIRVG